MFVSGTTRAFTGSRPEGMCGRRRDTPLPTPVEPVGIETKGVQKRVYSRNPE